jgi:hypothetical protein
MYDLCLEIEQVERTFGALVTSHRDVDCSRKQTSLVISSCCSVLIALVMVYMWLRPSAGSLFATATCIALFSDTGEILALVLLQEDCQNMTTRQLFGVDDIPDQRQVPCWVYPALASLLTVYLLVLMGYIGYNICTKSRTYFEYIATQYLPDYKHQHVTDDESLENQHKLPEV